MSQPGAVYRILFVCTGNIFRSLTADVAVRALLSGNPAGKPGVHVSSAGTDDYPHVVRPYTREYLRSKGFDVSGHQRRTVTQEIVDASHLVVAMSTDHQALLRKRFGRKAPLFLEVCGAGEEWLPDIDDVIPDYRTNRPAVEAHIRGTIDRIVDLAPRMAQDIGELMRKHR